MVKPIKKGTNTRKVGYGNPPPEHQWPKNKSGNPGGRPKTQDVDFGMRVIALFEAKLSSSDQTFLDLMLRGMAKAAANGDIRATRLAIEMYLDAKRRAKAKVIDHAADRVAFEEIVRSKPHLLREIFGEEQESKDEDPDDGTDEAA